MATATTLGKIIESMKKHILFSAVIALVATACTFTNEEIEIVIGRKIESFTGRIDNEDGRTTSVPNGNKIQMLWHADDQIAVTDRVHIAKYDLIDGEETIVGQFELSNESAGVTFNEGATLYGVVPYMAAYHEGNPQLPELDAEQGDEWEETSRANVHLKGRLNIVIPTVQTHSGEQGGNDYDRNIMVGKIADNGTDFAFKQIGSLVRFSITLPTAQTIYSAKIIAEDMHIAGRCIVDTDAERVAILEATHNELTLHYSNPTEKNTTTDGWAIIAPVDWTSSEGKVYYEIATSEGVYTFCKRPAKAFEVGKIYNLPLNAAKFKEVASVAELEDGDYTFSKNAFSMAVVNTTDSTATIAWTITATNTEIGTPAVNANNDFTEDYSKSYKVALYRDAACSDLVVSVDGIAGTTFGTYAPRFVFPALQPQTTYYAKVWNVTDSVESRPLKVATVASVASAANVVTENAKAGDMILYENFDKLVYAGDVAFSAAGVSYKSPKNLTTIHPVAGEIVNSNNQYYVVPGNQEHGLFNNFAKSIDDLGLAGWGWIGGKVDANGGSVCMRSGYLKVGTGSNCSFVCTPALTAIPEGKYARVKVYFKAAPIEKAVAVKALSAAELNADYSMSYSAECDVKTLALSGSHYYDWEEYEVTLNDLPHGGCVAIGGNAGPTTTCRLQIDDLRIVVEDVYELDNIITGTVSDQNGSPIAGVAVSDGFSVARTDSNGHYSLQTCEDTYYIYYSTPADCVVSQNTYNQPAFYTKYSAEQTVYDFTLTKMDGGAESQFSLFVMADPQVRDTKEIGYFRNETVPAVNTHVTTKAREGVPCYGVTLGDIVYSEYGGRYGDADTSDLMEPMRDEMKNFSIPVFQTIGNHDYTYFGPDNKTNINQWPGSSFQIKTQRAFEDMFGPINYSWNRGDAHIIHMRNIYFKDEAETDLDSGKYVMGFTDEQYAWLKQDLQFVPVDKLIILCVHIPVWNRVGDSYPNGANVVNLLRRYPNLRILSGHNHYMRYRECYTNVKEHTIAAVCGAWWSSKTNGDGAPNGYGVFDINGTTVENQYYMSVNQADDAANRDHQIRIYRGDLKCGNTSTGNYFELKHGSNVILANVFNACRDAGWTVKIYENDTAYDMTYVTEKIYQPGGDNSISAPSGFLNWYNPVNAPTDSNQDWWAIGYRVCMAGLTGSASFLNCFHMYKHTIQNTNATIRVEATDPYGRTYTQTDIIENGEDIYASIER